MSVVSLLSGVQFSFLGLCCLPLVMLVEYMFTRGVAMIVSAIDIYFRDLEHMLGILSIAWMFLTLIMYDLSMVLDNLRPLFNLNPMTSIITAYRDIFCRRFVP